MAIARQHHRGSITTTQRLAMPSLPEKQTSHCLRLCSQRNQNVSHLSSECATAQNNSKYLVVARLDGIGRLFTFMREGEGHGPESLFCVTVALASSPNRAETRPIRDLHHASIAITAKAASCQE